MVDGIFISQRAAGRSWLVIVSAGSEGPRLTVPRARWLEQLLFLSFSHVPTHRVLLRSEDGRGGWRRHQERKLRMLSYWRDAIERQLAAVNAAISTLEGQMRRDQPEFPGLKSRNHPAAAAADSAPS